MNTKKHYRVYRNLHKKCWSVQTYIKGHGWRLYNWYHELIIKNPVFIVYEKGRQKVIEQKKKNVHAYIMGELELSEPIPKFRQDQHIKINYNPYTDEFFYLGNSGVRPDIKLTEVYLSKDNGVYI